MEERDLGDYASVVEMRELLEEEGMVCVDWWEGYILHTRTAGRCYLDDDRRLELTTFRTVEAQREYLELIDEFGGVAVTGDLWAVVVDTIGQAETVQGALGGVIY